MGWCFGPFKQFWGYQNDQNEAAAQRGQAGSQSSSSFASASIQSPVTKALLWCGWKVIPVDILLEPEHDLGDESLQRCSQSKLQQVDCIMAALDCSTDSTADGHPGSQPLSSAEFPEGLPNLPSRDAARVQRDNFAAGFVLDEIHDLAQRGGATVRENPGRNLHWELPREKDLMDTGLYYDTEYSACVLQSARCKYQRLRHNVWEITQWPRTMCAHTHLPQEWEPLMEDGVRIYPSSVKRRTRLVSLLH